MIARSPWTAGVWFAALSLIGQGYRYGVADHLLHLPMAADATGASLPSGDLLAGAAAAHPTLWWWLLAPLSPASTLVVYIAVLVATGAALFRLSRATIGSATPWALLLLAGAPMALGGADVGDPLLLPRTAALPLELLAWAWFVEGRRRPAFSLLGLTLCLHAPSAAALGGALSAVHLLQRRNPLDLLGLPLFALPVVVPWASSGAAWMLDPTHVALIELRVGHHVAAGTWANSVWMGAAGLGMAAVAGWSRLPRDLQMSIGALVGVAAIGALGWSVGATLPVQLELWQAGRFLTIACLLAAAAVLHEGRRGFRDVAGLVLIAGALLPGGLLLLMARSSRGRPMGRIVGLLAVAALALAARHPPSGRTPARWSVQAPDVPFSDIEFAPGAVVATPPVGFEGMRTVDVGLFGTWKDGGEALFSERFAREWSRRMTLLCGAEWAGPEPRARRRGGRQIALRRRLMDGFESQDVSALTNRLRAEGVRYLVWPGDGPSGVAVLSIEGRHRLLDLAPGAPIGTITP